jgi:Activator of Hsp90 ATPase homolog 1-like protein
MSKPEFVYVTYIETTAEKLWQALTDGDFTERYWFGYRVASDWKPGSPYRFARQGEGSVEGRITTASRLQLGPVLARPRTRAHLARHLRSRAAWQYHETDGHA